MDRYERIYRHFCKNLDPDGRVQILKSSDDSGLAEYFNKMQSKGSTDMDETGAVYVKIHDAGGATEGTLLEEFAHAVQFITQGNVPLSHDNQERREREHEMAVCLQDRSFLSEKDRQHYKKVADARGDWP